MLATHDTIDPEELYTITAGGFSATADAFARDEATDGLWFVSMVGSQTALKAIWASLLKKPPDTAHIIRGADGIALSGGYKRCVIPHETVGTWTTKIARLPVSGGWHALVYTKTAEYGFEKDSFLLLAPNLGVRPIRWAACRSVRGWQSGGSGRVSAISPTASATLQSDRHRGPAGTA